MIGCIRTWIKQWSSFKLIVVLKKQLKIYAWNIFSQRVLRLWYICKGISLSLFQQRIFSPFVYSLGLNLLVILPKFKFSSFTKAYICISLSLSFFFFFSFFLSFLFFHPTDVVYCFQQMLWDWNIFCLQFVCIYCFWFDYYFESSIIYSSQESFSSFCSLLIYFWGNNYSRPLSGDFFVVCW